MPAMSAAKFADFVRNKGAYLPGIGVAPTSKTDAPIGARVRSKYPKGYSEPLLAASVKTGYNEVHLIEIAGAGYADLIQYV